LSQVLCRLHPEVVIAGDTADGVGWGELRSIEDVEELRSKLEVKPVVGGKSCSLKWGGVEIIDLSLPKTRLAVPAENSVGRPSAK
jgi:hypothetical protein